jgi:methyl-accepting chemotaxis protein
MSDPTLADEVVDSFDAIDRTFDDRPADDPPLGMGFRTRLTLALILAAVLPMTAFGLLVLAIGVYAGGPAADANVARILLFGLAIAVLLAVFVSYLLAADLTRPLRAIAVAVDRVSAGDLSTPIRVGGDDELARLADSHNRLAADLERRNRELGRILAAIEGASPRDGVEFLAARRRSTPRRRSACSTPR